MIAGIVLLSLGVKKTIEHVDDPLEAVPGVAMYGGISLYLLAHVAFRYRNLRTVNGQRLIVAIALLAASPLSTQVPALASLIGLAVVLWALITYEVIRFGDIRHQIRHHDVDGGHSAEGAAGHVTGTAHG